MKTPKQFTWGSPEADTFIRNRNRIFEDRGILAAYRDRLEYKKNRGYAIDLAAVRSGLPLLPHVPLVMYESDVPFWIELIDTHRGEYMSGTRVNCGQIDVRTSPLRINVLRAVDPFTIPQIRVLAQCAMSMSEHGLSIGRVRQPR